jgi:hypothetical protein
VRKGLSNMDRNWIAISKIVSKFYYVWFVLTLEAFLRTIVLVPFLFKIITLSERTEFVINWVSTSVTVDSTTHISKWHILVFAKVWWVSVIVCIVWQLAILEVNYYLHGVAPVAESLFGHLNAVAFHYLGVLWIPHIHFDCFLDGWTVALWHVNWVWVLLLLSWFLCLLNNLLLYSLSDCSFFLLWFKKGGLLDLFACCQVFVKAVANQHLPCLLIST